MRSKDLTHPRSASRQCAKAESQMPYSALALAELATALAFRPARLASSREAPPTSEPS